MKRLLALALLISAPAFAADFNGRGATSNASEIGSLLGMYGGSWGAIAGAMDGGSSSGSSNAPVNTAGVITHHAGGGMTVRWTGGKYAGGSTYYDEKGNMTSISKSGKVTKTKSQRDSMRAVKSEPGFGKSDKKR